MRYDLHTVPIKCVEYIEPLARPAANNQSAFKLQAAKHFAMQAKSIPNNLQSAVV